MARRTITDSLVVGRAARSPVPPKIIAFGQGGTAKQPMRCDAGHTHKWLICSATKKEKELYCLYM